MTSARAVPTYRAHPRRPADDRPPAVAATAVDGPATAAPAVDGHNVLDRVSLARLLAPRDDEAAVAVTWIVPAVGWSTTTGLLDTPDQLVDALTTRGPGMPRPLERDLAEQLAVHEHEHAVAAAAVGFGSIRYLVRRRRSPHDGSPRVGLLLGRPRWPVTKLAFAVTQVAPCRSTEADLRLIRLLGYDDVDDVGERVIVHNARPGARQLPVPAPYWLIC